VCRRGHCAVLANAPCARRTSQCAVRARTRASPRACIPAGT
jgi:hypothetical protein